VGRRKELREQLIYRAFWGRERGKTSAFVGEAAIRRKEIIEEDK